jgi:poly-gamma-glutamate synthesis protein (capsule biosynthesis protein)
VTYALLGYNGISDDWDGAGPGLPGTAPLVDWIVVEDIQREVANGHVVIPFFHWGTEYVYDPNEEQRYFAHIAIEAGAALVMGSHPHWVQAVETYMGKPIVYSLGNFVFDQEWSLETKQGMIGHVWMQRDKVLRIDLVPVLIEDFHKPRLMDPWEAAAVLDHVWAASDYIREMG